MRARYNKFIFFQRVYVYAFEMTFKKIFTSIKKKATIKQVRYTDITPPSSASSQPCQKRAAEVCLRKIYVLQQEYLLRVVQFE